MARSPSGTGPAPGGERTGELRGGRVVAAGRTDRGGRPHNEDAFVCRPDLGLFAVIDGMGGQQAGETAAALAKDALLRERDLLRGVSAANEDVHRRASSDAALAGMGCVLSALRVEGEAVQVAHVGDTRVYLAGSAGCEQLTRDHTVAARRQEDLGLDERTARGMGGHNQVTRDIGGQRRDEGDAWIDRVEVPLEAGDVVLLCSDGLHGAVPGDEIFRRLRAARRDRTPPEQLADGLVELAVNRGTRDNVTVVVLRAEPAGTPPPPRASRRRRGPRVLSLALLLALALAAFAAWGDPVLVRQLVEQLTTRGW